MVNIQFCDKSITITGQLTSARITIIHVFFYTDYSCISKLTDLSDLQVRSVKMYISSALRHNHQPDGGQNTALNSPRQEEGYILYG